MKNYDNDYDQLIDGKKEVSGPQRWIIVFPKTQQQYFDLIEVCCELRCFIRDPKRQRVICQVNASDCLEVNALIKENEIHHVSNEDYRKDKESQN